MIHENSLYEPSQSEHSCKLQKNTIEHYNHKTRVLYVTQMAAQIDSSGQAISWKCCSKHQCRLSFVDAMKLYPRGITNRTYAKAAAMLSILFNTCDETRMPAYPGWGLEVSYSNLILQCLAIKVDEYIFICLMKFGQKVTLWVFCLLLTFGYISCYYLEVLYFVDPETSLNIERTSKT